MRYSTPGTCVSRLEVTGVAVARIAPAHFAWWWLVLVAHSTPRGDPMALRVFIGSTSLDLADYRRAAIAACNELGVVPVAMEFFGAADAGATAGSRENVSRS